jgi:hypothetical protein
MKSDPGSPVVPHHRLPRHQMKLPGTTDFFFCSPTITFAPRLCICAFMGQDDHDVIAAAAVIFLLPRAFASTKLGRAS